VNALFVHGMGRSILSWTPTLMLTIPGSPLLTVAIIGTGGGQGWFTPFGNEVNDGVMAVNEVLADWLAEEVHVPVVHTFLPSSHLVSEVILTRLSANKL
jgi:hypothetical protein